jgi:hypothetical protein
MFSRNSLELKSTCAEIVTELTLYAYCAGFMSPLIVADHAEQPPYTCTGELLATSSSK